MVIGLEQGRPTESVVPASSVSRDCLTNCATGASLGQAARTPSRTRPATCSRGDERPGASRQLPSPALGSVGGGVFAVDPRDSQGVTALGRVFQLELGLPAEVRSSYLGARVYVRFDHGFEPIGFQIYRVLRQLFLRQFDV